MKCESRFKDANYSSEVYCYVCGMDAGLEPVLMRDRIFCCDDCAKVIRRE